MRAALDGRMPRSEARPAAASAPCHSECTSAQPSTCVAVIPLPPASIHFGGQPFVLHRKMASCSRALQLGRASRHVSRVVSLQVRHRAEAVEYRVGQHRSEEHTSELQSPCNLVCRLLLEKKNKGDGSTRSPARLTVTDAVHDCDSRSA